MKVRRAINLTKCGKEVTPNAIRREETMKRVIQCIVVMAITSSLLTACGGTANTRHSRRADSGRS